MEVRQHHKISQSKKTMKTKARKENGPTHRQVPIKVQVGPSEKEKSDSMSIVRPL